MRAVLDQDTEPIERWARLAGGETAAVWLGRLGGVTVTCIGVESRPLPRADLPASDGPDKWASGTLYPLSSKKVARAINAASGIHPVVVLANLSGFDGSPESLRNLQLEYGAEIGRAIVNFHGPIAFCVISRYHGGAYVVFSRALNPGLKALALTGSYASVIGGAPAAAVVFPGEVRARALKDPRILAAREAVKRASDDARPAASARYNALLSEVTAETRRAIAEEFDRVHCVDRARAVGSLDAIIPPSRLRPALAAIVRPDLPDP
jgi:acetyl-CoA carboxylase carboxyltransferase component